MDAARNFRQQNSIFKIKIDVRSKVEFKCHHNLIISRGHHYIYYYQVTSNSDHQFSSCCTDIYSDGHDYNNILQGPLVVHSRRVRILLQN